MNISARRHAPKIRGGEAPPEWLLDHTERNMHMIGPAPELVEGWRKAGLALPDLHAVRRFRLERIRAELIHARCDAILLYDPVNIRYATDSTNMSIWTMHNAVRYAFVPVEGPVVVFEFSDAEFLSAHAETVDEIRPATSMHPFFAGDRVAQVAKVWADEIVSLLNRNGDGRRMAVDQLSLDGIRALEKHGVDLVSGQALMEEARLVKHEEEIQAMRCAAHACQACLDDMKAVFEPGVSENELWATLQKGNFLRFGEWIETRLLSSGPRTNPWYQEASARRVQDGELMAFDTDLVGAYGICIDMSRTWLCGDGTPNANQAEMMARAQDTIMRNMELFRAGATVREITEKLWYPPVEDFNGYTVMAHGTGLCDEYPSVYTREKFAKTGYDMTLPLNSVMSVEAFVGLRSGGEGVKLEQQVVVREDGPELLTDYSLDLR